MPPTPLSGRQFELRAGDCRAVITDVGATLRILRVGARDLVVPFRSDELRPFYRGAVIAPWPNRLRDGRYDWNGQRYQVPVNEPERGNALHGLVAWARWQATASSPDSVVLESEVVPQAGYPFALHLAAEYRARADGLDVTLTATNVGTTTAPYGCTWHPYLVGGRGRVDDWDLQLPARSVLEVDPERLLPRALVDVTDDVASALDLRHAVPLGARRVDHAYTDLEFGDDGWARAELRDGATGVRLEWDQACRWVQVHTADRPEPEHDRVGLAVESMTCPPHAFTSGRDVVALSAGQTHRARWRLTALR
ncbi:MAG: aldose 1-epimerase family protein [Actinomycetes bacterium]